MSYLTSVVSLSDETVLVFPEVLQSGDGVSPPDVKDQLDPAVETGTAALSPTLPPVPVRPVGHVQHVDGGGLVEPVARHPLCLVLPGVGPVAGEVGPDGVRLPLDVLVTDLTGVLDIPVYGDGQPPLLPALGLLAEIVVAVVLLQTELVAPDMALQRTLVKQNLFAAQQAGVERLEEEIAGGGLHVVVELGGEAAVVRAHVTVKPPLLPEDCLAADEPALVAPVLLRLHLLAGRVELR